MYCTTSSVVLHDHGARAAGRPRRAGRGIRRGISGGGATCHTPPCNASLLAKLLALLNDDELVVRSEDTRRSGQIVASDSPRNSPVDGGKICNQIGDGRGEFDFNGIVRLLRRPGKLEGCVVGQLEAIRDWLVAKDRMVAQ